MSVIDIAISRHRYNATTTRTVAVQDKDVIEMQVNQNVDVFFFEISANLSPKECSATGQLCIRELLSYSDPFNSEYNKSHAAFHIERATYTLGRNRGVGVVTHDHNAYHCASRLPRRSLSFSSLTVIEWALDDSALRKVMTSNYNY